MWAIISLLIILTLSVLITRIAAVALGHTGLSRELARFQARSAFTGVGFTTDETEKVVNHPVRRRIILLLMLLGNAGIVSAISSLVLSFIKKDAGLFDWLYDLLVLGAGISVLWILAASSWIDRRLSALISWALNRWTRLTVADYTSLLHLSDGYRIKEVKVESGEWLANKSLAELSLPDEGIRVLGVERDDGTYVGAPKGDTRVETGDVLILYGRDSVLRNLDDRRSGAMGDAAHNEAVAKHKAVKFAKEFGKKIDGISNQTMDLLMSYSWPGNIRELRNVIERAVILADGPIIHIDKSILGIDYGSETSDRERLEEVERSHILKVLEKTNWVSEAISFWGLLP